MNSIFRNRDDVLATALMDGLTAPQPADVRSTNDELAARSRNNISEWRQYLPEDCVARMIAMRWDVTT